LNGFAGGDIPPGQSGFHLDKPNELLMIGSVKRTPPEGALFGNQFIAIFNVGITDPHVRIHGSFFQGIYIADLKR
jgi:hypothetical protein